MNQPNRHRVRRALCVLLVAAALLWIVITVMPGVSISSEGSVVVATLIVAVTIQDLTGLDGLSRWPGKVMVRLGGMFWLTRNTFVGSHLSFRATRRA